ncbi:hypothetical protein ILT44_26790 [Microvirga sp. BT689]|nr:hypothetical protein [Microvirga arvi]MBM6583814.1 hypothetical protein [Microvirga arvi]
MLEDTIGAMALGLQTLPSVCWVPVALVWVESTAPPGPSAGRRQAGAL